MKKWIALFGIVSFIVLASRYGSVGESATPLATPTLSYNLYLPAVLKGYAGPTVTPLPTTTNTPVPTWTPTATPIPCNGTLQKLQNTSFETGFTPWSVTGLTTRSSYFATDGYWSMLFGGYNSARDAIGQIVTVPSWAETAALYFNARMYSSDSLFAGYDRLLIDVSDVASNTTLAQGALWNDGTRETWVTWRLSINNITVWRGQSMMVIFAATTDNTFSTTWNLDQVYLVFGCGNTPASEGETGLTLNLQKGEK